MSPDLVCYESILLATPGIWAIANLEFCDSPLWKSIIYGKKKKKKRSWYSIQKACDANVVIIFIDDIDGISFL